MCLLASCISLEKCLFRFCPFFCCCCFFFKSIWLCQTLLVVLLSSRRAFSLRGARSVRHVGLAALRPIVCCVVVLLLRRVSCLYIVEVRPLSVAPSADVFSHSVGFPPLFMFPFLCKSLCACLVPVCLFQLLLPLLWETGLR